MEATHMSMMWLQSDAGGSGNSTLLIVFVGIIALGSLVQLLVFAALGIAAMKARKEAMAVVNEVKGKAMPLIASAQDLVNSLSPKIKDVVNDVSPKIKDVVNDVSPKIKKISGDLVDISAMAKAKVAEIDTTVSELNGKTRAQVNRLDGMVTTTLNATSDLASAVHHGITVPVREVAGVVAGVKAAMDVLVGRVKPFGAYGQGSEGDLDL